MHVAWKPGFKKPCSETILLLPHELTEVFVHHQKLNLHKKQIWPHQTDLPVSLSDITIFPDIQEDIFDSLPGPTVPRFQSTSRILHWTPWTPLTDYKIIGFWREEVLRSNLAIPVLPAVRTLQPREVILEAVKHLKIPLGSEVHKTDPTAQIFWMSILSEARAWPPTRYVIHDRKVT